MNKNQLKSFIRKTINEQHNFPTKKQLILDISNWIKRNGINKLPLRTQEVMCEAIIEEDIKNLPLDLQKIIRSYIENKKWIDLDDSYRRQQQ